MGGGEEGGRVVPRLESILGHRRYEMASLPIPDKLLGEILLRLPTPADLVRASATCVSFRRVAVHCSFPRRYHKLHAPPLLGFFDYKRGVFHPAIAPHPSASAASVVALAADFSFSFLPAPASDWVVRDLRDGRALLERIPQHDIDNKYSVIFRELVVCDPLHRRYVLLPPIAYDLAALVEDPIFTNEQPRVGIFLAGVEAATADETSFRVIWMAQCKTRLVAFVFSSNTRQWRGVPSRHWTDLSAGLPPLTTTRLFFSRHCVYGSFYWMMADYEEHKLLVLNTKTMEFSIAEPPSETNRCCNFVMVEAGEGRPGMFVIAASGSDLSYFIRQNDGGSWWKEVKTISLGSWAHFICSMEKYLLLYLGQPSLLGPGCFTLDIKTFQFEKVGPVGSTFYLRAYSNFPPSLLSSPTISSGVKIGAEKEMLEQGCVASSSAQSPRSE